MPEGPRRYAKPFAKVYASLWDGTLGQRPDAWSLLVFLVAHADAQGVVEMTPQAIQARSGLPMETVSSGLEHLEAPDPESRSSEADGRRLVRLDEHRSWGWRIVNYAKYRQGGNAEHCREYRDRKGEEYRGPNRQRMRSVRQCATDVRQRATGGNRSCQQAEAEAEADVEEKSKDTPPIKRVGGVALKREQAEAFETYFWPPYPRKVGREQALVEFRKVCVDDDSLTDILAGLEWYKANEWVERAADKIPHASTWLHQRRWVDARRAG